MLARGCNAEIYSVPKHVGLCRKSAAEEPGEPELVAAVVMTSRLVFFFQAEDGIRDIGVTGVQTCALPISARLRAQERADREGERVARRVGLRQLGPWYGLAVVLLKPLVVLSARRRWEGEIGRASCRERVQISVAAVSLKKEISYSNPSPPH